MPVPGQHAQVVNGGDDRRHDGEDYSIVSFEDEEMPSTELNGGGSRSSGMNSGNQEEEEKELTYQETKRVNFSKMMVYLALFAAGAAVSTVVYLFLSREEENTMVVEFDAYSREILKQAQDNVRNMFEELWDLGKAITSHALDANMTWPNCTIPHFDIRAHDMKLKSGNLELVAFAPFVTPENRQGWEQYSVMNQGWIQQDYQYRNWTADKVSPADPIPSTIHAYDARDLGLTEANYTFEDPLFRYEIPLWQVAPARKDYSIVNLDLATVPVLAHLLWDIKVKKVEQYSRTMDLAFLFENEYLAQNNPYNPRGTIYQPVLQDFREDAEVVGFVMGSLTWDKTFEDVLFESSAPLLVEIEGTCNALFTYRISGDSNGVQFLGYGGGLRDPQFDKYKQSVPMLEPLNSRPGYPPVKHTHRPTDATHGDSHCTYVMNTYPTAEFQAYYQTSEPIYMTIVIASIFVFTAVVFFVYDKLVQNRQTKLMTTARRTNAIVTSLFPKSVGKRLIEEAQQEEKESLKKVNFDKQSNMVNTMLSAEHDPSPTTGGKPIADLFPSATILFGDLVGFTAWSSTREPSHVFVLLERLFSAFDKIAKKRRVFKIETVGDCYVAVCGLPEKRSDHAVCMSRFARDCMQVLKKELVALETLLGPGTSSLAMRIGLHSGAVTAGVLRGERARFQLFGDSVNTCARIETTGKPNHIHISEQTANLLVAAGKQRWVIPRDDMVEAKGKGTLRTYWLASETGGSDGMSSMTFPTEEETETSLSEIVNGEDRRRDLSTRERRLVDWHVETLSNFLRQVLTRRNRLGIKASSKKQSLTALQQKLTSGREGCLLLDEVRDVIELPVRESRSRRCIPVDAESCQVSREVVSELTRFVTAIALLYHENNDFHNFDHASHVTMSVAKLLSRINEVDMAPSRQGGDDNNHDHAFGITSDPLTQFAVVFSAIIHDADHPGVPNSQLVKEGSLLASTYRNRSVAEQNSLQLAWDLLMSNSFANLRCAIYSNEEELMRFRQLLVNTVMATDIMDQDLGAARKARWNKAFSQQQSVVANNNECPNISTNRKATIVIEHLIQASDVAHTMQHWHIFCKWNESLFREMYRAYLNGRAEKDPSESWYRGELGFFDFYIIPLAKKLKDCGVFGVASDEYLNYAEQNRAEWELKGEQQVKLYLKRFNEDCATQETAEGNTSSSLMTTAPRLTEFDNVSISSSVATDEVLDQDVNYRHYVKRGYLHCDV